MGSTANQCVWPGQHSRKHPRFKHTSSIKITRPLHLRAPFSILLTASKSSCLLQRSEITILPSLIADTSADNFTGTMTNRSSHPVKPRLRRPTLPYKQILKPQLSQNKTMSLAQCVNLQETSDSRQPDQCDEAPRAILIPESSSDDEQRSVREPSSSNSSVSPVQSKDSLRQAPTTSRTGVYFENVEIQSAIHPLQVCCVEEGKSPLQARKVSRSLYGRPLSAAPVLPNRRQLGLKPLRFPALIESKRRFNGNDGMPNKKQRCSFSPQRTIYKASREAQVKEASFMIEAAVALANLQKSKAC